MSSSFPRNIICCSFCKHILIYFGSFHLVCMLFPCFPVMSMIPFSSDLRLASREEACSSLIGTLYPCDIYPKWIKFHFCVLCVRNSCLLTDDYSSLHRLHVEWGLHSPRLFILRIIKRLSGVGGSSTVIQRWSPPRKVAHVSRSASCHRLLNS